MQAAESLDRGREFLSVNLLSFLEAQIALQRGRFFLWMPVLFALGIGGYFSLSIEPPLWMGFTGFVLCLSAYFALWARGQFVRILMAGIVLAVAGFACAQVRTALVYTPVLEKKMVSAAVAGTVEFSEDLEEGRGQRVILSVTEVEGLELSQTPRMVRLTYKGKGEHLKVGQSVRVLAMLNPPSSPVLPEGFDFRRHLYFQSIGAVGFIYRVESTDVQTQGAWRFYVENLREYIDNRITASLNPRQAAITSALTVGRRGAISEADNEALRDAGLAHILSISGLHIALLAGTLFFIARFLMACVPALALRYPIKKIAAVFGILGALAYMVIAGTTVPTQRSVLTTGIIFLAIILDRSPISLRLVAFSAFVVLIFAPESLLSASFHMSFAAVVALVAFYEGTRKFWAGMNKKAGILRKVQIYFLGICVTTIVASITSGIYSLYHFQQFSTLGLISNFIVIPIMGLTMMPFQLLALFLMPVGAEYYPLQMVGFGVDVMLGVSYWVSSMPAASVQVAAWPFWGMLWFTFAGLFFVLWKGLGKILAVPMMMAGVFCIASTSLPDIMVSHSHKLFGFYNGRDLYVNGRSADKFVLENWERFLGLPEKSAKILSDGCDDEGCRMEVRSKRISFISDPYILRQECVWADIVVSERPIKDGTCKASVSIDKFDTWGSGAYAVWVGEDGKITVLNSDNVSGARPWSMVRKSRDRHPS